MWRDALICLTQVERTTPPQRTSGRCCGGIQLLCAALSLFLLAFPHSFAQDSLSSSSRPSLFLGIGGGYELGRSFGQFLVYRGGSATCGLFDNGRARAWRASGEIRSPDIFGDRLGLNARLSLAASSEQFTATPVDPQLIADSGEAPRLLEREFRFRSAFTILSADLLLLWRLGDRFSLHAGPSFGYRFSETFEQYDTLYGTDVFENGTTRQQMLDGEQFTVRPFSLGLVAGGGYRLPMGTRLSIEPSISVRLDIQGPVREMQRSTLTGSLGLALLYTLDFNTPEQRLPIADVQTPSPAVEDDPAAVEPSSADPDDTPPLSALDASLDVYSLDSLSVRSDTAIIPVHTVQERRFIALLPRLYFEKDGEGIPARYPLLDAAAASSFTLDSLRGTDPERVNSHLLNIVGKRLKDNPGTSVRLRGSISTDEGLELAEGRTRSVTAYLRDVWGIEANRIAFVKERRASDAADDETMEEREEQRYVGIEFLPNDLAAPVIIEQATREFAPPSIKLSPVVDADTELERWEITVRQGNMVVVTYSSREEGNTPSDIPWNVVAGEGIAPSASLVAELNARDTAGREGSARDTLPVMFLPDDPTAAVHERLFFILPGSWGDVSKTQVEKDVQNIVDALKGGERVRIYPRYAVTDPIATERSLALAQAIGETMLERLAATGIVLEDIVIERSPNKIDPLALNTPERRVAARGVVVVVDRR